ncbi:MAG: hypothetical protein WCF33_19325 [Pseudonocardiaceae bacterium]
MLADEGAITSTDLPTPEDNSVDNWALLCMAARCTGVVHRRPARRTNDNVRCPHRATPLELG